MGQIPFATASFLVYATAPGKSREYESATVNASSQSDRVSIRLWDAGTVKGRILDEAGQPVSGATVCAGNDNARVFAFEPLDEAKSGTDGTFELEKVPLGNVEIRAWAPGKVVAETSFWLWDERDDVQLRLEEGDGVTIHVKVDGLPEGFSARVRVLPYTSGGATVLPAPMRGVVGSSKHWIVKGLPDFEYRVSVTEDNHSFQPRNVRTEAGSDRHELVFHAVADTRNVIKGVLLDTEGRPPAGEILECRASNGGRRNQARTAADGLFSLESPLSPGTPAVIYLVNSDYVTTQERDDEPWNDARGRAWHEFTVDLETPLELRAVPTARVSGTVVDYRDNPVRFQQVTIQEANPNRIPLWMSFKFTTSDRQGRFQFGNVRPPDRLIRVAIGTDAVAQASEPFGLMVGEKLADLRLEITQESAVQGRVLGAQDTPIPGARVWLRNWDFNSGGQADGSVIEVLTDREGYFRFPEAQPGGHYVQVFLEGRREEAGRVPPFELEPGATETHEVTVRSPSGGPGR